MLGGELAALSAFILASRLNSGAGLGFELQVIAAAILGSISLTGGVGTLGGAFIGIRDNRYLENVTLERERNL